MSVETPQRRFADLAPLDTNNNEVVPRIKADATLGRRSTDVFLGESLTKADATDTLVDEAKVVKPNDLIISRTDVEGIITYCNETFVQLSGWSQEELMGSNHNLIRHPDMPQIIFKMAWDTISANKEFYGYLKNLCKDGRYYWAFAYISTDINRDGIHVGYTSSRRHVPQIAIDNVAPLYKILIAAEKEGGMTLSKTVLKKYLEKKEFSNYDQYIVDIQLQANASH